MVKKFGLVVTMLAAVCCGGLLPGCANGDGEENDSDYEEKKALAYWNKDYKADDYEWQDITDDNKDSIIGTWKAVTEQTSDKCEGPDEIGYSASMEFVIDNSFKCKFAFIDDSSRCESKMRYYSKWQNSEGNISDVGAKIAFPKEFVNGEGYKYTLDFDDKKYIATATAENLTLEQLAEVLRCEGFSISTTGDRLLLRNRPNDGKYLPATWLFTAGSKGESDRYGTSYVIARAE